MAGKWFCLPEKKVLCGVEEIVVSIFVVVSTAWQLPFLYLSLVSAVWWMLVLVKLLWAGADGRRKLKVFL